jgi:hypothetical protein
MKQLSSCSLALGLAIGALTTAQAATWSTTAQYGEYTFSETWPYYKVNNDCWGSGRGPQTLYVDTASGSAPHFWAYSQQPNTGGIKTYPHVTRTLNMSMSSIGTMYCYYNVSGGTGQYDWAVDAWVPSEVMVWNKWTSGVGPWGTLYQSNVSIGGSTYNIYKPPGYWSFLRTSQRSSGTENLKAIFNWLVNGGHLSDGTVSTIQYGVEITSGTATWTVNSCWIHG